MSLLPAEVASRFRVLVDSTAGSSAVRPPTSDAVRLADGPAYQKQPSSVEDPTTRTRKRAKSKAVKDSHLRQYVPEAHLQAAEAYSNSFQD